MCKMVDSHVSAFPKISFSSLTQDDTCLKLFLQRASRRLVSGQGNVSSVFDSRAEICDAPSTVLEAVLINLNKQVADSGGGCAGC